MLVGYIRVSTDKQNTARQEEALEQFILKGEKIEQYFLEKKSGKNTDREQLKQMLNFARKGDIVVVESYSRLARSTKDLLNMVDHLKSKDVGFISLKENFDTTSPQGELMLTIFAGLAQFERACTLERQKEGISIAKKEGKYKGRKAIEVDKSKFTKVYTEWKNKDITAVQAMEKLNIKPNTFYRRIKEYEQEQAKGV